MPHIARTGSSSGFYHVVPKGIADQLLFLDDDDRRRYIDLLGKAKADCNIILHAYVLMSNHVHLVVQDPENKISEALKYVHERYAMAFAEKIGRTGGIFRKPYWREPIEKDEHLLCAVRYVHANPRAAGICPASAYEWSSARDYLGRTGIADTQMILDMCGGRDGFVRMSQGANMSLNAFPGSKLTRHTTDEEAVRVAKDILGFDASAVAHLPVDQQREAVVLLSGRGYSCKRIMRLTGLGRWMIEKYLK